MNIAGQYLKDLDEQIENLKEISKQLKLIREDLEELEEKHQQRIDNFIDKNHEQIYEKFCEIYPERVHGDFILENLDYADLCEFVEEYYDI